MNTSKKIHPVYKYILDAIDHSDYGVSPETDQDKLQFVVDTFKKEYDFEIKRKGMYRAFAEWLSGLPLCINIEFVNAKILDLAVEWGSITENATEKQEDKILNNWFNFISVKFFQLCKRNKVIV